MALSLSAHPYFTHPSHQRLPRGQDAGPSPSVLGVTPLVTTCPLLTLSLCPLGPPCGCHSFSLSVSAICLSTTCLSCQSPTCHPASQLSHCPPGFSTTCHAAPPVPLLLSVCPRPAADTAFNSLCPSPCNFRVEGRGPGRRGVGHPLIL